MPALLDRAEQARSFDRAAEEYERTRPDYPDEALGVLPLGPDATVVDVGAGTGKLTRVLARHYARVLAVEPLDGMRAILEQVLPAVEAHAGSAEELPLANASVDGVFAAQAFHWFATDESVAEIARVLRPRGALVIFWNIPVEFADLGDEAEAVIDEAFERGGVPGLPRVLSGEWRRPIEDGPFEELRGAEIERDVLSTRDEWIANLLSVSSIAHQPEKDRAAFAARLRELVPADREVRRRIRTEAHWTRRV